MDSSRKWTAPGGASHARFKNNYFTEMCSGSGEGSYLRLIDFVSLNSRLESNKEGRKDLEAQAMPVSSKDATTHLPRETSLLTTYWSESTVLS